MKKILDFLKTNKTALVWVAEFIFAYVFILFVLFGFNLFSVSDWTHLAHAHLRGFPGFVFGVLILSGLPLLFGTTVIVIRTKKTLISLPWLKKKTSEKEEEESKDTEPQEPEKPFPDDMPAELKTAFLRARQRIALTPMAVLDVNAVIPSSEKTATDIIPTAQPTGLPLPNDFDFASDTPEDISTTLASNAPVFTEIKFDDITAESTEKKSSLIEHLEKKNYKIIPDGDVVVANGMAIITHADSDFWIADTDDWFAAGKQKKSPIADVIGIASRQNLQPVVYLAEKNIMDLDIRIAEWESQGIKVITDLTDID